MQRHILVCLFVMCVFVPTAFGQETTAWEHDAIAEIGHFEVTPLGSIFVARPDRTVVLDQYTGQALWERDDIQGCKPRADDSETAVNEADGTIRCRVRGMESRGGFGSDADFRTGARFSTLPNTNLRRVFVGLIVQAIDIWRLILTMATHFGTRPSCR